MKFYLNLITLYLTANCAFAALDPTKMCPPMDSKSYLTLNNRGNSTYTDKDSSEIILNMVKNFNLDLSKPILDVGAGYGTFSHELIKLGAKEIYINDLSTDNLACLKRSISNSFSDKKSNIHYINGDITSSLIYRAIPEGTLGLVYAKDVIHFFTATQIADFFVETHKSLETNGLLYLVFENPYLEQQNKLINTIDSIQAQNQAKGTLIPLDDIVIQQYKTFAIGGNNAHCSADDYERTPKSIRTAGFPCLLSTISNGEPYIYQLLKPELIAIMLEYIGFSVIGADQQNDAKGTIVLLARKK